MTMDGDKDDNSHCYRGLLLEYMEVRNNADEGIEDSRCRRRQTWNDLAATIMMLQAARSAANGQAQCLSPCLCRSVSLSLDVAEAGRWSSRRRWKEGRYSTGNDGARSGHGRAAMGVGAWRRTGSMSAIGRLLGF